MTTPSPSQCPGRLAGRVALISGGAQGIGRAIASLFQREGACVFVLDSDSAAGSQTAAELSEQDSSRPVRYLAADLCDPAEIQNAVRALQEVHSRIDVLINNAGLKREKPLEKLTVADWDVVLNVNLRGAFLLTQSALPLFPASGGAIVNVSSIHASHAFSDAIPYACSKGWHGRPDQESGSGTRPSPHPGQLHLPWIHRHTDVGRLSAQFWES